MGKMRFHLTRATGCISQGLNILQTKSGENKGALEFDSVVQNFWKKE